MTRGEEALRMDDLRRDAMKAPDDVAAMVSAEGAWMGIEADRSRTGLLAEHGSAMVG